MRRVVIVGGGISGLALAHAMQQRLAPGIDIEILLLERSARAGGHVRTEVVDGFTCESGPNGFLDSAPATLSLVNALGIEHRMQPSADAAGCRYIYRRGRLRRVPAGAGQFLRSGVLSWPGKLRVLLEPLAAPQPPGDETLHAFATRRLGREAAEVLIDAMAAGMFAGDSTQLSLRACFPRMCELEQRYGGLFRAMLSIRRERRREHSTARGEGNGSAGRFSMLPAGRLTSFRGGMEDLIRGLVRSLEGVVHSDHRVTTLSERGTVDGLPTSGSSPDGRRFLLDVAGGTPVSADAVVLAGPVAESARIVEALDPALASAMREIPTAPLAVVCLGYDEAALRGGNVAVDGFGFLVPRGAGPCILGVQWDSSIYPGRAPAGRVLIRVMLGGARDPAAVDLSDERLLRIVRDDLRVTMHLDVAPMLVRIFRHRRGIPQYTVGHHDRLARIEARRAAHPGLFLAGSSYRGPSVNACIAEADPLADRVRALLGEAG